MTPNRKEIVDAKIALYRLLVKMEFKLMTQDDINIGRALLRDTEIRNVFTKKTRN